MKRRISIYLLIACLLLSTLAGCAPVAPPIDDTPVSDLSNTSPSSQVEQPLSTPEDSEPEEPQPTPTPAEPSSSLDLSDSIDQDDSVIPPEYAYPEDVAGSAYSSIEALKSAILEKANTADSNYALNQVNQIQTLYVPVFTSDVYHFHHVEVTAAVLQFYYVLEDALDLRGIWSQDHICVTIRRDVIEHDDLLSVVEKSLKATRNEDGYVYSKNYNKIGWVEDGYIVIFRFPESISDYDTMISHCKLQKVTIDHNAVTE